MPTALVTGATGFTGGVLARRLAREGWSVTSFVRESSDTRGLESLGVARQVVDLADAEQVEKFMRPFDRVFHLAATYREEPADRSVFHRINVVGTENLLRAAAEAGVGRFVHCSTVGIHGHVEHPPADESYRAAPNDHYQESKWEGEQIALRYFAAGLPGSVVRPGAIYGPGDRRFLKLFRAVKRRRFAMIGGGRALYHLVYVDDLVEGFLRAAERSEALGEVFIVAGERPCTVGELVAEVARALGAPAPWLRVPLGPVRAAAVVCERVCHAIGVAPPLYPRRVEFFEMDRAFSIEKARRLLGYEPGWSLARGIDATARGYEAAGLL